MISWAAGRADATRTSRDTSCLLSVVGSRAGSARRAWLARAPTMGVIVGPSRWLSLACVPGRCGSAFFDYDGNPYAVQLATAVNSRLTALVAEAHRL